jgi:hypothetical protein
MLFLRVAATTANASMLLLTFYAFSRFGVRFDKSAFETCLVLLLLIVPTLNLILLLQPATQSVSGWLTLEIEARKAKLRREIEEPAAGSRKLT